MKALVIPPDTLVAASHGGLHSQWQHYPTPACPPQGALLNVAGCGLCGTDVDKLLKGRRPATGVLGHEVVGTLAELAPDVDPALGWQVGQRVMVAHHVPCGQCHYCLNASPSMCKAFKASNITPGGYAETIALSGQHLAHTTFAIPQHISWREASCIEPLACVVRAVDKCPPTQGKATAAVVGLGFIGQLAGQVFGLRGFRTLGLDVNPKRVALANLMQSVTCATLPQEPALQTFLQTTPAGGVDVVCLTVVNAAAIAQAMALVREGGTLLIIAGPPSAEQGQLCADTLYHREVSVVTSYSPSLASLQQAATWLFERHVSVTPLITHPMPITAFDEGVTLYRQGEAMKVFYEMASPYQPVEPT